MPAPTWTVPANPYGQFDDAVFASALWVHIPTPVVSKANHRMFTSSSRSASWAKVRSFETEVALALRAARPASWNTSGSGPVASRPRTVAVVCAVTLLDAGNVSKSLLDAAQGVLYPSDAQVGGCAEVVARSGRNQWSVFAAAQPAPGVDEAHALAVLLGRTRELLA